jgi:hypothetical protein
MRDRLLKTGRTHGFLGLIFTTVLVMPSRSRRGIKSMMLSGSFDCKNMVFLGWGSCRCQSWHMMQLRVDQGWEHARMLEGDLTPSLQEQLGSVARFGEMACCFGRLSLQMWSWSSSGKRRKHLRDFNEVAISVSIWYLREASGVDVNLSHCCKEASTQLHSKKALMNRVVGLWSWRRVAEINCNSAPLAILSV